MALLPSTPETLRWGFSESEKQIADRRTRENFNIPHTRIRPKQLLAVIKDPKAWFYVSSRETSRRDTSLISSIGILLFVYEHQPRLFLQLSANHHQSAWVRKVEVQISILSVSKSITESKCLMIGISSRNCGEMIW